MSGPPGAPSPPLRRPSGPRFSPRGLVAALPDFAFAGFFLQTWIDPDRFGEGAVGFCMLTMLIEFVNVHSSGFMGLAYARGLTWQKRVGVVVGLGLVYSLFVAGFSAAFSTWWPLLAFWLLTANRMLGVLLTPELDSIFPVMARWACGAAFYLFGVFLTVMAPVPRLGLAGFVPDGPGFEGNGLWEQEPWRVVAFGALYFTLQGAAELFLGASREPATRPAGPAA